MANFGKLSLTNTGVNALVKAQAGNALVFSKIKMGSGVNSGDVAVLTDLVETRLTAEIVRGTMLNNSYTVEAHFTNEGLEAGFYWRELGLYIKDSNGNDALFGYANSGTTADYIPATESEIYTKHVRIAVAVGDVQNITISNSKGTYVDIVTFTESLEEKVDKVEGKGLSTNDYSNEEKSKLYGIESGANNYKLPVATSSALGGVKSGGGISIDSNGNVSLNAHSHKVSEITDLSTNAVTGIKGSAESSYRKGNVNITKDNIGLGNVDNTSDKNKPISTATQTELTKLDNRLIGLNNSFTTFKKAVEDGYATTEDLDAVKTALENTISALDKSLNGEIESLKESADAVDTKIGNNNISGIGDGTLTGAIAKLYEMISNIPAITSGTSAPSGGNDGDVYIMHE